MYILAIETTGPLCSVALLKENQILNVKNSTDQKNHLRDLTPLIKELLEEAMVDKSELDFIVASKGPGSFTGVRIGVTTARALGQVLEVPLVGVGTLDAFCFKPEARAQEGVVACGIINARRGQVYGIVDGFMDGGAYMLVDVLEVLKKEVLPKGLKVQFFGDGIDAYEKEIIDILGEANYELQKDFYFCEEQTRYQDGASVGLAALEKIQKGQVLAYNELMPDYMRKAEAQQKLEAGELNITSKS